MAVGTGVTDGTGVKESTKARTVALTSIGVAVGIGALISGLLVGAGVSVGTGVNAATMACTVARTSTGVGVTGGGCTQAVTASNVTSADATAIEIFMFHAFVSRSDRSGSMNDSVLRAKGSDSSSYSETRGVAM